jgi:hypothetical protein
VMSQAILAIFLPARTSFLPFRANLGATLCLENPSCQALAFAAKEPKAEPINSIIFNEQRVVPSTVSPNALFSTRGSFNQGQALIGTPRSDG